MSKCKQNLERFLPYLILLLGAFLRLFRLGSVPAGLHQDETFVAWNAFALWKEGIDLSGDIWPVYLADWGDGHSALYSWLLVPLYAIVGEENITYFVSRLPQAIVGILTIWVVYLLLKKLFGKEMGLWGMFLLAICPWHITMNRWGLDANLAPGFLIFGLYFFVKGLDNHKYLLLSAVFYGLSLYCYAVIWPLVPLVLLVQIVYGLYHKKLKINGWAIGSSIILAIMALPLLLFIYVNSTGQKICLPFMTIPVMEGYRGDDLAVTLSGMLGNIKRVLSLLWHQNIGLVYDILLPHGLFYDIGRLFIVVGAIALIINLYKKLKKKELAGEFFVFVQLAGAGVICALVTAYLHQVNCLYIPLVFLETYGVVSTISILRQFNKIAGQIAAGVLMVAFSLCLIFFQKDYYGDYEKLLSDWFMEGVEEAVEYAMESGDEIVVERGIQWPRVLYFSRTLPSEYVDSAIIRQYTEPVQFSDGENTFYVTIDYENIDVEKVYIFYFPDKAVFEKDFDLVQFKNWYVAVPK